MEDEIASLLGPGVRLLSFDGVEIGTREISQLVKVKEIMQRVEYEEGLDETPRPFKYFDLIGGSGMGGVFAILFGALGMSVDDVFEAYTILYDDVFSSESWAKHDLELNSKLCEDAIEHLGRKFGLELQENLEKLAGRGCRSFICALNADNTSFPLLFRSYKGRKHRTPKCTVAQALKLCMSGHPHLNPVLLGNPREKFVSAVYLHSDPANQLFDEAQSVFGEDQAVACVISLGTGHCEPLSLGQETPNMLKLVQESNRKDEELERRCGAVKDFFFRLDVLQGLEANAADSRDLSKINAHTVQYLKLRAIDRKLDRLVKALLQQHPRVTSGRLNSVLGPDPQDLTLDTVKRVEMKLDHGAANSQDDRYHEIATWLCPNNSMYSTLAECRNVREEGTGRWFFTLEQFKTWRNGGIRVLALSGIPGGGKTILASIVYDYLKRAHNDLESAAILAAFIKYNITKSVEDILSCYLCQVMLDGSDIATEVETLYKRRNHGRPSRQDLVSILRSRLSHLSPVFLIMDALDEFPSNHREKLVKTLLDISPNIQLFVTSRPIPNVILAKVSQNIVHLAASDHTDLESLH